LLAIQVFVSASNASPIAFPNPSKGLVSIQHPGIANADFELVDLLGASQRIAPIVVAQDAVSLDLQDLPCGWYALRIYLHGEIYTQKVWLRDGN